ncbi:hypothetical protein AVEN_229238-1, partial [Araneus ventricosus]
MNLQISKTVPVDRRDFLTSQTVQPLFCAFLRRAGCRDRARRSYLEVEERHAGSDDFGGEEDDADDDQQLGVDGTHQDELLRSGKEERRQFVFSSGTRCRSIIELFVESWDNVAQNCLGKSWKKLWPSLADSSKVEQGQANKSEILPPIKCIPGCEDATEHTETEWLSCDTEANRLDTDEEIISLVQNEP